ncbi:polymer-forming cytoskeletal protein [Fodinibius sp.]|uniref:bactofilin family protein n=1 Tax=Fodinibius sp. TaxID=1872440 RepID=UPI002ACD571A|nr:polymer-forming cytoskeletal protein [Fodinibius sp.]MDZ7657818.1 polymer-forming cytoskeletal protein [Fodinibius sp.]
MENNKIVISKNTFFEGEISAGNIIIEGKVIGNFQATSSVLIKEDGWVEGDIYAPSIYLAKGCYHEGDIYLEDLENASSAKINMNKFELKSDDIDEAKAKETESSKEQSFSNRTESKF